MAQNIHHSTAQIDPIVTRPDGSIDVEYYLRRGRLARGQQAQMLGGALSALPGKTLHRIARACLYGLHRLTGAPLQDTPGIR